MEKILTSFLIEEKSQIAKGRDLKILGLEYRFSKPIWVKGLEKEIIFKGSIDRIDSLDGVIRFVDYKTGNVTGSDLSFRHWDELISDPKKSPLFQVLLYAYAIKDEFKEDKVWAGVIPLKNFENNFIAASITENSRTKTLIEMNESILLNFEKELFAIINEIFDPNIPFVFKI
jgi:ATP-dependent helicase/DNAse subunit B